jgi:L-rhamnose mutarotase
MPSTPPNGKMDILELSGSPKTFATRRMLRQGQFGAKSGNVLSPSKSLGKPSGGKHARRFQNIKTDVISTAIPEVQSEEDNSSPNASNERTKSNIKETFEVNEKTESLPEYSKVEKNTLNTIFEEKASNNIKDNIFLKEEENNFTKTEIQEQKKSTLSQLYTRAQIQQQRAQFLLANTKPSTQILNNNNTTFINNNKTAQFKNGHYAGIAQIETTSDLKQSGETTPVTATTKAYNTNNGMGNEVIPSLETAL